MAHFNQEKGRANFRAVLQRLYDMMHHERRNINILVHGPTTMGKSTLAYRIMWNLDVNFTLQRFASGVNGTKQFMHQWVQEPPSYSWFCYDDAGVGIPAKRWYEEQAVIFGNTLQFGGNRLYGVLFTAPDMAFIEPTSRSMLNFIFEMDEDMKGFAYVRRVKRSRDLTHPYKIYPYLRISQFRDNVRVGKKKITYVYVDPLPEWRYQEYDRWKRALQKETFQVYLEKLTRGEVPVPPKPDGRGRSPGSLAALSAHRIQKKE